MAVYTKEFLIDAFMYKYIMCKVIDIEKLEAMYEMCDRFYDEVGRDEFRRYCNLTAPNIREYLEKSK